MYYYVKYDQNHIPYMIGESSFKQDIQISKEEYDMFIQEHQQIYQYIYALQNEEIQFSDIPQEYQDKVKYKLSSTTEEQEENE